MQDRHKSKTRWPLGHPTHEQLRTSGLVTVRRETQLQLLSQTWLTYPALVTASLDREGGKYTPPMSCLMTDLRSFLEVGLKPNRRRCLRSESNHLIREVE